MILSPKQRSVWREATRRWNVLVGAVRSGKTYVNYFMIAKRMRQLPPGNAMLIGKTERTYARNVLDPMRQIFGEELVGQVKGGGIVALFGRRCYIIGANDERAISKLQGIGLVYANGDEFPLWPESFFQMLKSRLSEPGACCDLTANPENPHHWAKTFIDTTANLASWHFTIDDNPFLDSDYVEAIKSEYTGIWRRRYILGEWCAAEGAVYSMFDEAVHVVDCLPMMRRYWVAIDYGTTNPTVFLLVGEGVDNCLYVMDEYRYDSAKHNGIVKTDLQYKTDYSLWIRHHNVQPRWVIIDPSAASFIAQMAAEPKVHNLARADNAVVDGIRRTSTLLSAGRLKIHRSCTGGIAEMSGYTWDAKASEHGEDIPIKKADHGPDALRYLVNATRNIWGKWISYREAA